MIACKVAVMVVLAVVCCEGQQAVRLSPSPLLVVREGEDARFTCESEGGDGPVAIQINSNVSFIADEVEDSEEGSGDVYSTVRQISSVERSDNGTTIQCFSNARGSNTITLIVDYPPQYAENVTYVVIEGSSPRVQLSLDATRVTSFDWVRNGERIDNELRRRVLFSDAIVFDPISRDDAGTYKVIAFDNLGSGEATATINVYYPPKFLSGLDLVNASVVQGNDITLDCSVVANPAINNLTLTHDLSGAITNVAIGSEAFVITAATGANTGRYTCHASNLIATTSLIYNLVVGELPNIEFTLTVTIGTTYLILDGTFTDNSVIPVERFIINIVGDDTYYVGVDQFPLQLNISLFTPGDYDYTVHAVNAIGNVSVDSGIITIPEPTTGRTSGASTGSVAMIMLVFCAVLAFLNN